MSTFTTSAAADALLSVLVPEGAKAMRVDLSWVVTTAGLDSVNVYSTNDDTLGLAQSRTDFAGWDSEPLIENKLQCADGADGSDTMEIAARKKYYGFHFQHVSGTSAAYAFAADPVYSEGAEPSTLQIAAVQTLDADPGEVVFVFDLLGDTNPGLFLRWDGDADCDDGVVIEVTPFENAGPAVDTDWWPVDVYIAGPAGSVGRSWIPLPNIAGEQIRVTIPYDSGTTSDVEAWLARMEPRFQ